MNITQEYIDLLLDSSEVEEHLFHRGKCMVQSYKLPSGFTVEGMAGLIDLSKFDIEIGRKVCRRDASTKLWTLEGYLLQKDLEYTKSYIQDSEAYVTNLLDTSEKQEEYLSSDLTCFWVEYTLKNGGSVIGSVSVPEAATFDLGWLGRARVACKENALSKLRELERYRFDTTYKSYPKSDKFEVSSQTLEEADRFFEAVNKEQ